MAFASKYESENPEILRIPQRRKFKIKIKRIRDLAAPTAVKSLIVKIFQRFKYWNGIKTSRIELPMVINITVKKDSLKRLITCKKYLRPSGVQSLMFLYR